MKTKYSLSNIEKKALEEFKRRLRAIFGKNFLTLRLFGSRARGNVHCESDIDVLIIFEDYRKPVEEQLIDIICDILNEFGVYFEVISYSRKAYEQSLRRQWPFILNVERESILI